MRGAAECPELREPPRPELLGQPDQVHEDLGRGLGVGQGTVARPRRDAEEVGERGEADAAEPSLEQAPGERRRAERRLGQASTVSQEQLPLDEALVEAGVVRDEQVVACEAEEAPEDGRDGRRTPQLLAAQAGEAGDRLRERDARVDERLERVDELERPDADGADLADAVACGREPGRLQVEDDELGLFQQAGRVVLRQGRRWFLPRRLGCRPRSPPPTANGRGRRDGGSGKERAGCVDRRQRAALLEQVHQPVEGVERELHRHKYKRTYVRLASRTVPTDMRETAN